MTGRKSLKIFWTIVERAWWSRIEKALYFFQHCTKLVTSWCQVSKEGFEMHFKTLHPRLPQPPEVWGRRRRKVPSHPIASQQISNFTIRREGGQVHSQLSIRTSVGRCIVAIKVARKPTLTAKSLKGVDKGMCWTIVNKVNVNCLYRKTDKYNNPDFMRPTSPTRAPKYRKGPSVIQSCMGKDSTRLSSGGWQSAHLFGLMFEPWIGHKRCNYELPSLL